MKIINDVDDDDDNNNNNHNNRLFAPNQMVSSIPVQY